MSKPHDLDSLRQTSLSIAESLKAAFSILECMREDPELGVDCNFLRLIQKILESQEQIGRSFQASRADEYLASIAGSQPYVDLFAPSGVEFVYQKANELLASMLIFDGRQIDEMLESCEAAAPGEKFSELKLLPRKIKDWDSAKLKARICSECRCEQPYGPPQQTQVLYETELPAEIENEITERLVAGDSVTKILETAEGLTKKQILATGGAKRVIAKAIKEEVTQQDLANRLEVDRKTLRNATSLHGLSWPKRGNRNFFKHSQ